LLLSQLGGNVKAMTGLFADPFCKQHDTGPDHPESPARFDAVFSGLKNAGLLEQLFRLESRDAVRDELLLCHTSDYLNQAEQEILHDSLELSTGDTPISKESWSVALRSVGGVFNAVDAVMTGAAQNAFCVVRPPGHHATAKLGMGFCIFRFWKAATILRGSPRLPLLTSER
jgi:acetoin utilization deacetylase AcuC-like enzyme